MMSSGGGHLEGAARGVLAADFGQVLAWKWRRLRVRRGAIRDRDRDPCRVFEESDRIRERAGPPDWNPGNEQGFGNVGRRHEKTAAACGASRQRDRENAPHRPHRSVERELPHQHDVAGGS
jgi:hypothetical protein